MLSPNTPRRERVPIFGTIAGWVDLPGLGGLPVEKGGAWEHYQNSFHSRTHRLLQARLRGAQLVSNEVKAEWLYRERQVETILLAREMEGQALVKPPKRARVGINSKAVENAVRADVALQAGLSPQQARFARQAVAKKILPGERVEHCFDLAYGSRAAHVCYSKEHEAAHVKGVMVCGSIWSCPICSRKVSKKRLDELTTGLAGVEYGKFMVTLTIQHSKKDRLSVLLADLAEGVRKLRQGRQWAEFSAALGLVGSVTNLEYTYGENGHHAHKHILLLSELPQSVLDEPGNRARINAWLEVYRAFLTEKGYHVNEHTTNIKICPDLAGYLVKWSLSQETILSDRKEGKAGHYSPFQLLDLIRQGQTEYIDVFREYFYAFKGRKQLSFSRGLRALLGMGKAASDEELAEEEQNNTETITLVSLEPKQYQLILGRAGRGEMGRLLEVAGKNDLFKLWDYLHGLGIKPTSKQLDYLSLQLQNTS